MWGTFQDRLTSELRPASATDLEGANVVLRRFLSDYNRRFGCESLDGKVSIYCADTKLHLAVDNRVTG